MNKKYEIKYHNVFLNKNNVCNNIFCNMSDKVVNVLKHYFIIYI